MPNITLAVPEDLHAMLKRHPEVSWSEVARRAMWEYARKLELLDKLTAGSTLTEQDIEDVGKQVKAAIRKRHGAKP
jgi:hypothetical protein